MDIWNAEYKTYSLEVDGERVYFEVARYDDSSEIVNAYTVEIVETDKEKKALKRVAWSNEVPDWVFEKLVE